MARSARALLVAFFLVATAFIGATFWAQRAARVIDADTLLISREAAPGIRTLSALRAELRSLELETFRSVHESGTDNLVLTRTGVDALIAQAAALSNSPLGAAKRAALETDLRAFDDAAGRARNLSRAGSVQAAQRILSREARPAANAAATLLNDMVDREAQAAESAAIRIEESRRRANLFADELDALCAVLAMGAAYLALRVVRASNRVQQENQRLVERKAEELEEFAGRVAHDVLSPLTSVGIALSIAGRTAPATLPAVSKGAAALDRVRGIVDGLLEFARAGARARPGARTEVPPLVAGLCEELAPFAAEHGAKLLVEPPPRCSVPCSQGVLLSLLQNLLRNAIKYLGDAEVREVSLRIRRRRGRVLFEVEDTGPGIPPSLGARIFDPYVRGPDSHEPGIGLGLATVKRLVVSHGGTVGVREGSRGGALFWFELDEAPAVEVAVSQEKEVHAGVQ